MDKDRGRPFSFSFSHRHTQFGNMFNVINIKKNFKQINEEISCILICSLADPFFVCFKIIMLVISSKAQDV